jgi:NAD(P)-dependent dehydrogenase (short-subunit alcohol dehydrogenase family)
MSPAPQSEDHRHHGSGKVGGKAALIEFGHLDILVNNAAEQHPQDSITKISLNNWNGRSGPISFHFSF